MQHNEQHNEPDGPISGYSTDEGDDAPFVDGIKVVTKPRIAPVHTSPRAVLLLLTLTGLLAVSVAYIMLHSGALEHAPLTRRADTASPSLNARTETTPPAPAVRRTTFARYAFSAVIPPGWQALAPDSANVPAGLGHVTAAYSFSDARCIAAYGAVGPSMTGRPSVGQPLPVGRDGAFVTQIEPRAASAHASTTSDATATAPTVEFAYYPLYYDNGTGTSTRNAWVLFAPDDTPVPTRCTNAFASMLGSLAPAYHTRALARSDTGILYIESDATNGSSLLFRDRGSGIASLVATLSPGRINEPTQVGDTLYYVGTSGELMRVGLFSDASPETLGLGLGTGESVNDFLVAGELIYSLSGAWCGGHLATCDLTLMRYDLSTNTPTVLARHVTDRTILGLANDGNALYLAYNEVDAGCSNGNVHRALLPAGTYEDVYTYAACEDDVAAYASMQARMDEIIVQITPRPAPTASLTLADGMLTRGPTAFEGVETTRLPILAEPSSASDAASSTAHS